MCHQNCKGLLKSATKTAKDCSFMTVDKMQSELPPEAYLYLNLCKFWTTLKHMKVLWNTTQFSPRQADIPNAGGTMSSSSGSLEHWVPTTTRPSPRHVLENEDLSDVSPFRSPHRDKPESKYSLSPIHLSNPPSRVFTFLADSNC